ncbi:MAG: MipA/OmpV family protein [Steroidobacteraceae bacterium]
MHRIPRSLFALLAALVVLAVTLWWAPPARAGAPDTFDPADTNHDGRVTLEEFEAFVTQRLKQGQGPAARKFRQLSPAAQRARLERFFEQLDSGHKGYLDRSDWSEAVAMLDAARKARPGVPAQGLVLGAGLADVDPGYIGYHRRTDPFPLLSYRSGRFYMEGLNAGLIAAQSQAYALSVTLRPDFNRLRASDSPQLAGIRTREWTIDGGVRFSLEGTWGRASAAAMHDLLDRSNGTTLSLGYEYPIALGRGVRLTPGMGLEWESAGFTDYYYGVSTAESLPNRPAYSPGRALDPSGHLDLAVPLSPHWHLGAGVSYTRFGSSIRESPLVDRPGSLAVAISLAWWDSFTR